MVLARNSINHIVVQNEKLRFKPFFSSSFFGVCVLGGGGGGERRGSLLLFVLFCFAIAESSNIIVVGIFFPGQASSFDHNAAETELDVSD